MKKLDLIEATCLALEGKLVEDEENIINLKDNPELKRLLDSGYAKFDELYNIFWKLFEDDTHLRYEACSLIESAEAQLHRFIEENDLDYEDNNMYMEENHLVQVIIDRLEGFLEDYEEFGEDAVKPDFNFMNEMYS